MLEFIDAKSREDQRFISVPQKNPDQLGENYKVSVIHQDDFYFKDEYIFGNGYNWDMPESIVGF